MKSGRRSSHKPLDCVSNLSNKVISGFILDRAEVRSVQAASPVGPVLKVFGTKSYLVGRSLPIFKLGQLVHGPRDIHNAQAARLGLRPAQPGTSLTVIQGLDYGEI